MSGLISFSTLLSEAFGPGKLLRSRENCVGIIVCQSCRWADVYFIAAVTTMLFILLNSILPHPKHPYSLVSWHMLAMDGWFKRQYWQSGCVLLMHYGCSFSVCRSTTKTLLQTLLIPSQVQQGCLASFAVLVTCLIISSMIVLRPMVEISRAERRSE